MCLPNDTHGGPHETFAAIAIRGNNLEKVEDIPNERLELSDCDPISMKTSGR